MNKEGLRGIKFGYGRDTPDPRRAQHIGDSSCPTPRGPCVVQSVRAFLLLCLSVPQPPASRHQAYFTSESASPHSFSC